MDTATMKLLHNDIDRTQRLCPLHIRKAKMRELKIKKGKIYAEIAIHGNCPEREKKRRLAESSIKLMSLFLFGVNLGEKNEQNKHHN